METSGRATEAAPFSPFAQWKITSNFLLLVCPFQCKNRQWKRKGSNPIYRQHPPKKQYLEKKEFTWCNSQSVTSEHSSASSLSIRSQEMGSNTQEARAKARSLCRQDWTISRSCRRHVVQVSQAAETTEIKTSIPESVKGSVGILVPKSPAG